MPMDPLWNHNKKTHMKITNIKNYLGGADQVVGRDILEGNQFKLGVFFGKDVSGYSWDVDTQLFRAKIEESGSNVSITSLVKQEKTDGTKIVFQETDAVDVVNYTDPDTGVVTENALAQLKIKETLLSSLVSQASTLPQNAEAAAETPYIIALSMKYSDQNSTFATKKSIRFLFIVRYQPTV